MARRGALHKIRRPLVCTVLVIGAFTALVGPVQAKSKSKPWSYTDKQTGMTATIVRVLADYKGGEFIKPKKGRFWEEAEVTVHNGSKKPQYYNTFDFAAVDNRGVTYNNAFTGESNRPDLGSGKMPAHQTRRGWLIFEIPKSTKTLTITWGDGYKLDPPAEIVKLRLRR